jgi:formate hydrogenlyase subunit 4
MAATDRHDELDLLLRQDNPSTHLELTMVHEATVLEYSGPDLALVELAAALRLVVLLGL